MFGILSWRIIEMELDTSKRLPMLAAAEIPFNVKQNRSTKDLRIVPHLGRQNKKTVDARRRPNNENNGNQALFGLNFLCFSSRKSGLRWRRSRIIKVLVIEPYLIAS
jgi:hypothetical protein